MKAQIPCIAMLLFRQLLFGQVIDTTTINRLSEVVVTATRGQRVISSLPIPAQLISSQAIERGGATRLNEVLAQQTGLFITSSFAGAQGVQMQGLDAAYTLILLDGLPLIGRSSGTLDLSRISVGNIERIEIIKGASSSLYGSEALAGVINIITKKPKENLLTGSLSCRYASFGTIDSNALLDWKKRNIAFGLFANYYSTEGYDLDRSSPLKTVEAYNNLSIHPKMLLDLSQRLKLSLSSRYYFQKQDNRTQIDALYYSGDAKQKEWNMQAKLEQKWNAGASTDCELYSSNYQNNSFLNSPTGSLFESNTFNQWLYKLELRNTFTVGRHIVTTGIGKNIERLERTYFREKAGYKSQFVFAQFDYNPSQKWNVLAGLRYDHNNQYRSQLSPKLAVNYKLTPKISLKTSLGYGFKAPDFRQLYFDFTNSTIGYTVLGYNVAEAQLQILQKQGQLLSRESTMRFSDRLKPESSINGNLGAYYQNAKIKAETNLFYNRISNQIDTRAVARKTNGQSVFSYFNNAQVFTYGLESNLQFDLSKQCVISLGYQMLIAKDKTVLKNIEQGKLFARDPQSLSSFQIQKAHYFGLFNRSKHAANMKFFYRLEKLGSEFNLQLFYKSKYGLWDSNGNLILDIYDDFVDAYTLCNLSVTKHFKKLSFQVGAHNLFDFTNPSQISSIPGRQIFAKIQLLIL